MQGLARKLKQQESFSGFGAADLNDVEEVDSASDGGTDAEHTASLPGFSYQRARAEPEEVDSASDGGTDAEHTASLPGFSYQRARAEPEEVDSASDGGTDAEHTASPGQLLAPLARPPIRLEVTVHMDGSEERVRLEVSRRIGAAADARGWRVEGEVVVRAGGSGAWVVVVSLVGPRGEQEARTVLEAALSAAGAAVVRQ